MIIREARKLDAESIININITSWKETYCKIFPDEFLNNLEQKKDESIEKCKNEINEYIVCEINNEVIGFLRFGKNRKGYSNKFAEIYAIYIISQYKRHGIGKQMLEYVFAKLKKSYNKVLVSTLSENSATKFYEKCGGKQIGTCHFKLCNKEYLENLYLFNLN